MGKYAISSPDFGEPKYFPDQESVEILYNREVFGRNIGAQICAMAGRENGARAQWVDRRRVILVTADNSQMLFEGYFGTESPVGVSINKDKLLTKKILLEHGVSTPIGRAVRTAEEAVAFHEEIKSPIVLKPRFGHKGQNVVVNLDDADKIIEAFQSMPSAKDILAEEDILGVVEYRCVANEQECLSVVLRVLPWVTGDGHSSVVELIRQQNWIRQLSPSSYDRPTPIDQITEAFLKSQGIGFNTILEKGRNITVRNVGGLSSGGVPVERSEIVDADVKSAAAAAIAVLPGVTWGGVDVMVDRQGKPYVIEVNSDADFSGSCFPHFGAAKKIGSLLFNARFRNSHAEIAEEPLCVAPNPVPSSLSSLQSFSGRRITLSDLLKLYFINHGWEEVKHSALLSQFRKTSYNDQWLSICSTVEDLATHRSTLRKHTVVRKLLGIAKVLRPRVVSRISYSDLEDLLDGTKPYVVMPSNETWFGKRTFVGTALKDFPKKILADAPSLVAQVRPAGELVTVLASVHGPLLVVGAAPVPDEVLSAATTAATLAVRAIPELRWGAVDVVVRPDRGSGRVALVEGMKINPSFNRDDLILAGDLDATLMTILGLG